jgi:hypothetical protein
VSLTAIKAVECSQLVGLDMKDLLDTNPDFREVIVFINGVLDIKTTSSCQGHHPGAQYTNVLETMVPYFTLERTERSADFVARLKSFKFFDHVNLHDRFYVSFKEGLIDHWDELLVFLTKEPVKQKASKNT